MLMRSELLEQLRVGDLKKKTYLDHWFYYSTIRKLHWKLAGQALSCGVKKLILYD